MLLPREYKPKDNELIYHYCDANSFHQICTNHTLRLSDLLSMNDFFEFHWGYSIWEKAASKLIDELGKDFLDKIDEIINISGLRGLLLATCFSLEGDVLSQWRAYTNDGKGYAIGFNAKDILKLPIRPLKVLYDESKQIEELVNFIKVKYTVEQNEKVKFSDDFKRICYELAFDLCSYKNPAFKEEQEVRIVHLLNFETSNDFLKLVDVGGTSFGRKVNGKKVQFRMIDSLPVAFIECDFTNKGKINPIKEVILGPKNDSLPTAISVFLETNNIGNVKIKKSKASYR